MGPAETFRGTYRSTNDAFAWAPASVYIRDFCVAPYQIDLTHFHHKTLINEAIRGTEWIRGSVSDLGQLWNPAADPVYFIAPGHDRDGTAAGMTIPPLVDWLIPHAPHECGRDRGRVECWGGSSALHDISASAGASAWGVRRASVPRRAGRSHTALLCQNIAPAVAVRSIVR
jgi:hypothetical protein